MKKFRRILSFIVAMAMIMSMSTLCFLVTAEDENISALSATGTEWKFNIGVGDPGTPATLTDGLFSLHQSGGTLDATVSEDGYITANGGTQKVFTKSATGIIDIAPDTDTTARIVFTAPLTGIYMFDISLDKADMPEFDDADNQVKNWTEIGKTETAEGGFNGEWVYKYEGITNVPWYDGATANVARYDCYTSVELTAGQCITLSLKAEGNYSSNTTLNRFNVNYIGTSAVGAAWELDEDIAVGEAGTKAALSDGPFSLFQKGGVLDATVSEDGYITANGGTQKVFTKSATGIIDLAPDANTTARVVFTAPFTGLYLFDASLKKTDLPAFGDANQVKNWTEIGATETADGGFNGAWAYKSEGITNVAWYGDATANVPALNSCYFVELTAGQCITVSMLAEGNYSSNTTLDRFNVSYVGTTAAGTAWELDEDLAVGEAGSMAALNDGPFSLHQKGGVLDFTVSGDGYITANGGAQNVFTKSETGAIDMAPNGGAARIVFTAPIAGTYLFDVSLEKTDMPAFGSASQVKNWTEIGKTTTWDGGFNGAWVYKNRGITNVSGYATATTESITKFDWCTTIELAAGECITVSITPEGTSSSDTTVNKFNVNYLGTAAAGDFENLDITIGTDASVCVKDSANTGFSLGAMYELDGEYIELELEDAARASWGDNYPGWYPILEGASVPYVFLRSAQGGLLNMRPAFHCTTDLEGDENDVWNKFYSVIKYTAEEAGDYLVAGDFAKAVFDGNIFGKNDETDDDADITDYISVRKNGVVYEEVTMSEASPSASILTTVYLDAGESLYLLARNDYSWTGGAETVVNSLLVAKAPHVCDETDCTGACVGCGEVTGTKNPANHADTTEVVDNGDGTHTTQYKCCGAIVSTEDHVYDNGSCVCGNTCEHTGEYTYTDNGDGTHTKTCNVCGTVVNATEAHVYENGTCACGAGCEHTGEYTYTDNGDGTHTKANKCCGVVVDAAEDHNWSNGVCADCEAECGHADAPDATCTDASVCPDCGLTVAPVNSSNHTDTTEVVDNGNGTHTTQYKCCGAEVSTNDHNFVGGVCDDCGAGCQHTGEFTYTDNGDGTHTKANKCCGVVVDAAEAHNWSNGVCADGCGAGCDHADAPDATCTNASVCPDCGLTVAPVNSSNHTDTTEVVDNGNGTHTTQYKCCEAEVSTEGHDWSNEDGVCADCEAECDHDGEYTYSDNGDRTHTKTCVICDAVVDAAEDCRFVNGECANGCGATADFDDYEVKVEVSNTTVNRTNNFTATVKLFGSKATYAAGELVVIYDQTKFDYVSSTLIDGGDEDTISVKVDEANGKIVIVVAGANVTIGDGCEVVTFAFTAIDETAGANITVESAAFSTRADAATYDLTPAVLNVPTATVKVIGKNHSVHLGTDLSAGSDEAVEGEDYVFNYTGSLKYYTITATVGGNEVTVVPGANANEWKIPGDVINGAVIITAALDAQVFNVTINGNATGNATATYMTDYVFTVAPNTQVDEVNDYKAYVLKSITIGGVEYNGATSKEVISEGKTYKIYTIPGKDVTEDIVITVEEETVSATNVTVTVDNNENGMVTAETQTKKGEDFTFTVDEGRDSFFVYEVYYTVAGATDPTKLGTGAGDYTIPGAEVTGSITITIVKVLITNVSVADNVYLQLGTTNMWLVLNTVDKLESGVYSIDGNAMFWSDKYTAYCYLVIAESAPEAESFSITYGDGKTDEVVYDMNVNKSNNGVDANDAQLVWNMYNVEYTSFDVVTVEKFLRADVTGDKAVNVLDAAMIINARAEAK